MQLVLAVRFLSVAFGVHLKPDAALWPWPLPTLHMPAAETISVLVLVARRAKVPHGLVADFVLLVEVCHSRVKYFSVMNVLGPHRIKLRLISITVEVDFSFSYRTSPAKSMMIVCDKRLPERVVANHNPNPACVPTANDWAACFAKRGCEAIG